MKKQSKRLNCAVFSGEMQPWTLPRPVRYLPGQWIAVCFHHTGEAVDTQVRATFRLVEVPAPEEAPRLVVVALVEHGGFGSAVAAPIARKVFLAAFGQGQGAGRPPVGPVGRV